MRLTCKWEIALKSLHILCQTHRLTTVSAICIELTFLQKQMTCDLDYTLVKVALF